MPDGVPVVDQMKDVNACWQPGNLNFECRSRDPVLLNLFPIQSRQQVLAVAGLFLQGPSYLDNVFERSGFVRLRYYEYHCP